MNIFILSENPKQAAQFHNDKHVVKMVLETAQILSTALYKNGYDSEDVYKPTHKNHPCVKWAAKSRNNFLWLCELGFALCDEYKYRYNKWHKSYRVISQCFRHNLFIPEGEMTKFAQAMPEKYRDIDPIKAYRQYYLNEKDNLASWKNRNKPNWWTK